jgi:hypothetical protein
VNTTSWAVIATLGVYHGVNPAMGWLFAVALGLQEGRSSAVLRAIPPIAIGHTVSVAVVVVTVSWAGAVIPVAALRLGGAAVLLGFAGWLLARRRHRAWRIGMRARGGELALWSFIMTSAHGSGLMLLPVLLHGRADATVGSYAAHSHAGSAPLAAAGAVVLAIHTAAMLIALTAVALVSYRVLGLAFLRRAWLNLDVLWIAALVLASAATLLSW